MPSTPHTSSRCLSPHDSSKISPGSGRRPRLMRAPATAPSLATSNASRQDLASLHYTRATALLTRVASYGVAQPDGQIARREHRMDSAGSLSSSPEDSRSPGSRGSADLRKEDWVINQCGNYFSFPSFEDFEAGREDEDKGERPMT